MSDWLDRQADALGVEPLTPAEAKELLDLAGFAAHETGVRTNAPLLCYLLGRAGGKLDERGEIVRSTS